MRQAEAAPIWSTFERWLQDVEQRASDVIVPQSDLAKALQDVRNHFLGGSTDYVGMVPRNWAAEHPEAIRTDRDRERHARATRQQSRRASRRPLSQP